MESWLIALVRLHVKSLSEIADALDIGLSNLLAALGGRRPLPEKFRAPLFDLLGLDEFGQLRKDRAYCLTVREDAYLESFLAGALGSMRLARLIESEQPRAFISEAFWVWDAHASSSGGVIGVLKASESSIDRLAKKHAPVIQVLPNLPVNAPQTLFNSAIPPQSIEAMLVLAKQSESRTRIGWRETLALADAVGAGAEEVYEWLKRK